MLDNFEGTALEKALARGKPVLAFCEGLLVQHVPHALRAASAMLCYRREGRLQLILRSSSGTWRCTMFARSASQLCDGAVTFLQMCALPEGNNCMKADLVLLLIVMPVLCKAV